MNFLIYAKDLSKTKYAERARHVLVLFKLFFFRKPSEMVVRSLGWTKIKNLRAGMKIYGSGNPQLAQSLGNVKVTNMKGGNLEFVS